LGRFRGVIERSVAVGVKEQGDFNTEVTEITETKKRGNRSHMDGGKHTEL